MNNYQFVPYKFYNKHIESTIEVELIKILLT